MAKRYEFRFETLLRLRKQREDERKRVVAERLREIRTLEERKVALANRISLQMAETRTQLQTAEVDVDELKLARHWLLRLRRGVLETDAAIATQRALLAQERSQLAEAAKETKVLVRLKERRLSEYMAELDRREQLESDEMNVARHGRFGGALEAES